MMSKYFVCCEKCFEKISRRNTNAAKLWMNLCTMYLDGREERICLMAESPELRVLECLRFLVSTETEYRVYVKISGHMKTEDGEHFFCVKGGMHA